jgi:hypothetical protein
MKPVIIFFVALIIGAGVIRVTGDEILAGFVMFGFIAGAVALTTGDKPKERKK